MVGPWFSLNGRLLPVEQAVIPADDINFAYGYGVYETLKVRAGQLYFADYHEERLFHSASLLGLEHTLKPGDFVRWLQDLVAANQTVDANLKALLIGGNGPQGARLYILQLNPLFPDRKNYKQGGTAVTFEGERFLPGAKSLNMLVSTLAYRQAQAAGAYDALLVNRHRQVTEGTRTNLFVTDGTVLITPPARDVLEGVTRLTVLQTVRDLGIPVEEAPIPLDSLSGWQGAALTSTSTKIMPLRRIDDLDLPLSPLISQIMVKYDEFLLIWSKKHKIDPS